MAFLGLGSKSSDFPAETDGNNILPPCPGTPNCIRIGRKIKAPKTTVLQASVDILQKMHPEDLHTNNSKSRISCVFKVFIFRDDLLIQLETAADNSLTNLYLRSASRKGSLDLGVNRRRVKSFLKYLRHEI